jgi:hypothetical protein
MRLLTLLIREFHYVIFHRFFDVVVFALSAWVLLFASLWFFAFIFGGSQ